MTASSYFLKNKIDQETLYTASKMHVKFVPYAQYFYQAQGKILIDEVISCLVFINCYVEDLELIKISFLGRFKIF